MEDLVTHTKILLVDDEEEFLAVLARRLEARNFNVSQALSGEEAIEQIHQRDFDAILLDLSMPGMDGLETLRRIKADHPEADVIILTGHATVQAGVAAMKLGADDLVEKPVDLKVLLKKIEDAKQKHLMVLQKKSKEEIKEILRTKGW